MVCHLAVGAARRQGSGWGLGEVKFTSSVSQDIAEEGKTEDKKATTALALHCEWWAAAAEADSDNRCPP